MKKTLIIKLLLLLSIFSNGFFIDFTSADGNISKEAFTITVSDYTPMGRGNISGSTLSEKANKFSEDLINILMVPVGVISLLIISIGAGYMIFYNGKEEFLTKGRSMIYTGFLALFIALCSAYIIKGILYILYN